MANVFKVGASVFKVSTNLFKVEDSALGELYWDANAGTAGQTDGAGAWLAANQWWDGAANLTWVSASYARFGWGGTGGAVTLASPTNARKITLNNFSGTYTLGTAGQTITLYAGILLESTSGACTVISPITLSASQVWFNRSASLLTVGTANVVINAYALTVGGSGNTTVSGVMSGASGSVIKQGAGTLILSAANTYTGTVTISGGILKLGASSTTSASSPTGTTGVVTVASGAAFDLAGFSYTLTHTQAFSINGTGVAGGGAIMNSGGAATLIGPVTVATAASIVGGSGTIALTGTIPSGATAITFGGAAGGSIGTVIAGSGRAITKEGAGTWTFSGTNTYTGATRVSGGTLAAGSTSAFGTNSAVTMDDVSGAILNITGFANSIGSLTGGGATGGNIVLGAAILTIGGDATSPAVYAGIISGTGGLVKTGAGTLTLSGASTYSSTTTINVGTLKLAASSSTSASSPTGTTGRVTVANGAVFDLAGFSYTSTHTQPFTINGTGISSGGAITNSGGASTLIGPITFGTAASVVGASGTIAITGTIVSGTTGITLGGAAGGSISTVVAGARTVTKAGAGTWIFTGTNTYSGITTISAGVLQIGNNGTTGTLGTGNVTDSATLTFWRSNDLSVTNVISGAGQVIKEGAGILTLGGGFSATGGTITTSGGYTIHTFTTGGTFTPSTSGNVEVLVVAGGGGGGNTMGGGGGGGGIVYNASFAVSGAITVTVGTGGAGAPNRATRATSGTNSVFSTITAVGGGGGGSWTNNVAIKNGAAGGSGGGGSWVNGVGGDADYLSPRQGYDGGNAGGPNGGGGGGGGASAVGQNCVPPDAGDGGAGTAYSISGSSLYYAGGGGGGAANSAPWPTVAGTGGSGVGGNGGAAAVGSPGADGRGGGGGGGGYLSSPATDYAGGDGGDGVVIVRYLTPPTNTYTGATTVNGGTIKAGIASVAGVSGAFGNNSAVTMANTSGAAMNITGYDTQIGSLTGGGGTGGNVTLGSNRLTIGGDGTSPAAYAGVISGTSGTITKTGAGTLILSGANIYTGATTISAGTLNLTGSLTSAVTVSAGGTFAGPTTTGASATTTGAVTVANSTTARIRAGSFGNNTLNTGALTFSGSSARMECDSTTTTFSLINVTGTCALGGAGLIFNAGITTNGVYNLITASSTMSGTLPVIITNNTGKTLVLSQSGNNLRVTVS